MKRRVLFFVLLSPLYSSFAQETSIDFEIRYELGKHHEPINGISLNDTGLFVGLFYFKEGFFKSRFVYETLFIPIAELDSIVLYRLKVFLEINENFKNVESFFPKSEQPYAPRYFMIKKNESEVHIFDYYFSSKHIDARNYDRYLINELYFYLNDLIPEKHANFRQKVPYYLPEPKMILRDKKNKSDK